MPLVFLYYTVGDGSRLRLWLLSVSQLTAEREAQAKATKRQSAEYREREAQAKATKRQSAEYREGSSG